MKKATRFVALFTALVLICMSATGCNALDEMRKAHGVYTKEGNIKIGDTEYICLPKNEYFSPFGSEDYVYVTNPNVPVLLSTILGNGFDVYNDGLILSTDIFDYQCIYCRADKHKELAAQMDSKFSPTDYGYIYSVLDTETEQYEERGYLLTKEQKAAVDTVIATVEGVERSDNAHYTSDYFITLEACTDNMLLREWAYDIEKANNTYYIITYDDITENGIEHTVPSEYKAIFDQIMKAEIDAQEAASKYYNDLYGEDFLDYEDYEDYEDIDYDEDLVVI